MPYAPVFSKPANFWSVENWLSRESCACPLSMLVACTKPGNMQVMRSATPTREKMAFPRVQGFLLVVSCLVSRYFPYKVP